MSGLSASADPVDVAEGGMPGVPGGCPHVRQPLNLASKLKLLGVVVGDRGGVSAIIEELGSKRQLFVRLHEEIPDIGEIAEIQRSGILVGRALNRNSCHYPPDWRVRRPRRSCQQVPQRRPPEVRSRSPRSSRS